MTVQEAINELLSLCEGLDTKLLGLNNTPITATTLL